MLKYDWLTGGPNGKGPERGHAELVPPSWMPFADAGRLAEPLWVYCLLIVFATVLFLLARNFIASRPGRALLAARDNAASTSSSGVDVAVYKAMAFAVERSTAGLAGSMLMMNRPFASEVQFGTKVGIFLVVGLVIGGVGIISGSIPGAFVYLFVPYFLSEWAMAPDSMPPGVRQVAGPLFEWLGPSGSSISGAVFGLVVLVLVFFLPNGFVGGIRALRARVVTVIPHPAWLADVRRPTTSDGSEPDVT